MSELSRTETRVRNLLEETLTVMEEAGVTPDDVRWVGARTFGHTDWANFAEVAKDTEYDPGYGSQEIADDLTIVGDDWWMTRSEYDGGEWWCFHRKPERPAQERVITTLRREGECWCGLAYLHDIGDD